MLEGKEEFKANPYRRLERIVKGFANHRRIQILELVEKEPELSVLEIAEKLHINFKTASEHIRRLAIAGLLMKRSQGLNIRHRATDRGLTILKFLRILE
ncbi:MAG: winged helix-turn-helix transcriptional regulator [Candidatus Omnitrophota bacterium]|nr:winged helix-turn-helix transcriptional regulator [Candidatus Omnitrophota bacterium]